MGTPEAKRPREEDGVLVVDEAAAKKARVGQDGAGSPSAAAVTKPKPAIDLSVVEKAKKALQLQKDLKEKMKRLQAAKAPGAAPAPAPAGPTRPAGPPPLVVAEPAATRPGLPLGEEEGGQPEDDKFYDPEMGNRAARRLARRPRNFSFVEEGRFQKQAEMARLRARFGDTAAREMEERRRREAEALAVDAGDVNLVPIGKRVEPAPVEEAAPVERVPNVEWWDARILADRTSYGDAIDGALPALRDGRVGHLVEHPPLLEPPAEAPPPAPQPLKLTKKELKKLRTQRRQGREKEKQELIRQGLLEPPKPKVKISNLMRVLGETATADPTAVEAEVRRQMAERSAAHDDRNLARKLTPAERRDKKLRKLLGQAAGAGGAMAAGSGDEESREAAAPNETHVAVYKVGDLSSGRLRFKVDVNAQENHMTGAAVLGTDFAVVVVEGGPKTLRRYEKLMLRRINWNQDLQEQQEDEAAGMDAADGDQPGRKANYCHMVWQGVVSKPAFHKFGVNDMRPAPGKPGDGNAAARAFLGDRLLQHYWDLAAAHTPE